MQDILNTFKALSDETRLRVLKLLEHGELCVCDIVAALDMIQPKISFHLSVLREARLIKDRKQGKWVHYRIEVPILQGLIGSGMGKGPARALLLAGPALSLPNMLVIWRAMGTKKTVVFVCLVIVMATVSGMLFGFIAG